MVNGGTHLVRACLAGKPRAHRGSIGGNISRDAGCFPICDAHFWIIIISSVNTSFDIAEIRLGTTELCHPRSEMSKRERSAASAVGEEALMSCHLSNHYCKATIQAHIVAGLAAWQLV